MDFMERISRNVEKRRKKIRLSADRLSKKADISISTLVKIRRLETKDLKVSTFLALAKALDCSLDELVG